MPPRLTDNWLVDRWPLSASPRIKSAGTGALNPSVQVIEATPNRSSDRGSPMRPTRPSLARYNHPITTLPSKFVCVVAATYSLTMRWRTRRVTLYEPSVRRRSREVRIHLLLPTASEARRTAVASGLSGRESGATEL
jgi:hypothetical protein